jgi:single-strand DNA-binding protein
MSNEAMFSVAGYIATQPLPGRTRSGVPTLSMRLAWTPRRLDRATGDWADEPSSFASVRCFRKLAENGSACLRKGDPVVVSGTMRIREYDAKDGSKRTNVDVTATSIGHDLSRGVASFNKLRPQTEPTGDEFIAAGGAGYFAAGGLDPAEHLPPDEDPSSADEPSPAEEIIGDADIDEVLDAAAAPA